MEPPDIVVGRNYLSYVGATPFYLAARNGDVALMRLLAANGADPLIGTVQNVTPLMAASGLGSWEGESPGPLSGTTEAERLEAVKLAYELGGDVNAVTDFGDIPIVGEGVELLNRYPDNLEEFPETALGDMRWGGSTALHGAVTASSQHSIIQFPAGEGRQDRRKEQARMDPADDGGGNGLRVAAEDLARDGGTDAEVDARAQSRSGSIQPARGRGADGGAASAIALVPGTRHGRAAGARFETVEESIVHMLVGGRMKRLFPLIAGWVAITVSGSAQGVAPRQQPAPTAPAAVAAQDVPARAVFDKYCVTCHNQKLKTAGLMLDTLDVTKVGEGAATWEKVVRRIRSGSMPPAGMPRPDQAVYDSLGAWLETELDRAAAAAPNPGRVPAFQRLTRTEYQNAIRDLLALDDLPKSMEIALLLPADNSSSGFDNLRELLFVSETQLEQYLSAARKISRLAVGDPAMPPILDTYRVSPDLPQDGHIEGTPFGARGGAVIHTTLPLDGEYGIEVELAGATLGDQFEASVDGQRVHLFTVVEPPPSKELPPPPQEKPGQAGTTLKDIGSHKFMRDQIAARRAAMNKGFEARVPMKAGQREIVVTFLKHTSARGEEVVRRARAGQGRAAGHLEHHPQGPIHRHRSRRNGQPQTDLRLPPLRHSGRNALCAADHLDAGATSLSQAADRRRRAGTAAFLCRRAGQKGDSRRGFNGRSSASSSAPSSCSASRRTGMPGPIRRIASATSSWPPVCRCFSGAAFQTTSCWPWQSRAS